MAIREIVLYPDPVLVTPAAPVDAVDDSIRQLVDDMAETMYAAPGIGLAAPQVGVSLRVAVIDLGPRADEGGEVGEEGGKLYVLINPEITSREGSLLWEEGCLSIPNVYEKIERANRVTVRALDRDGNPYEIEAEGLLAVALQHEIDHLDGVLFFDRMSHLKRRLALKKYRKALARGSAEKDSADETAGSRG